MNSIKILSNTSSKYISLKNKLEKPTEPETTTTSKPNMNSTDTVSFKGGVSAEISKQAIKKAGTFAAIGTAILGFLGINKQKKEATENIKLEPMKDTNELQPPKTDSSMKTAEELQLKETKAPEAKIINVPKGSALAALNPYVKSPQLNISLALKDINKYKLPDKAPVERETLTSKIDAETLASRTAEAKAEGEKVVEIPTYLGSDGETYHKQIFNFDGQLIGERSFDGETITEKISDHNTGLVNKIKKSNRWNKPLSEITFLNNGNINEKYYEYSDTQFYLSYALVTEERNSKGEVLNKDTERAYWSSDSHRLIKHRYAYDKPYSYNPETQVITLGNEVMYNPENEKIKQKYFEKLNKSIENTLKNGYWEYSSYEEYVDRDVIICWVNDENFKGSFRVRTKTNRLEDLSVDIMKDNEKNGYISYMGDWSGCPATMAIGKNYKWTFDESKR